VHLGEWLFRRRTAIPIPLGLALLVIPAEPSAPTALIPIGIAIVAAGEALRLWAVRHIGVISRTRSDRLGPLVSTGPFAFVRNPLYLGNIALWVGFAISARILWLAPIIAIVLALEYSAIVRYEEKLLESRRGNEYREYVARVPRWMPASAQPSRLRSHGNEASFGGQAATFSWGETLFSERGTLIAIAAGFALIWAKGRS